MLVAGADLQPLFELPVLGFELCGFCCDDGQVPFVELAPAFAVLLQNISRSLKWSSVALKSFLSLFKLLRFPLGVDLPLFCTRRCLFGNSFLLFRDSCFLSHFL